ncbi:MAG: HAD family hydrolase [Calditrichaceae bacterium]
MIEINIPGSGLLRIKHLVMDYNGTLALDGKVFGEVKGYFEKLSEQLDLHVLTADTFGSVQRELKGYPCRIHIISSENQSDGKLKYTEQLGISHVVSIGNGRNDRLMLKNSLLGIAVIEGEGICVESIYSADIVVKDISSAFELLLNPDRLVATLRD